MARPVGRAERRLARRPRQLLASPPLVVGVIVLVGAVIAGVFSLRITGYEPDEIGYTHLAIGIAHSLTPFTLSYGGAQRVNQLYPLLIAPLWGPLGNVTAFRLTHALNALLLASAAIPTYLLARELVGRRWPAYLAAALIAVMPWMTLATAELTEVAAFPACAWALLAMQRTLAQPSPKRDLLALGAIAIASYGRLQLIVLAPVLVAAMLLHELLFGLTSGDDRRAGVRDALRRMARLHAPLSALGILGVAIGLPLLLTGTLAKAAGFYGDTLTGASLDAATFSLARSYVVFLALGLGALPAAIAFGFFGESLVAPVSRRAHAFACLSVLTIIVVTLQVAEISVRFDEGVLQERYLFYLAPLLVVGLCAGMLLTRRPFKMILGGSIVLAALAASTHYQTARTAFWYQISPALTGFYDWIRPAFGAPGGAHAEADTGRLVVLGLVVLALGVLVAALARRISAPRLLAGVGVLALLFCGTETVHALSHVVHGTSSGAGLGEGSLRDVSWVDRSAPPGAPVADLVSNVGGLDQSRTTWEDDQFWNRSVTSAYTFGPAAVDTYLATTALSVDSSSGAVVLGVHGSAGGAAPPLGYLVAPTRGFPVQLAGTVLGHSRAGTLELLRLAPAPHAAWRVVGVSSDGWLPLQAPATVQLYSLRASRRCARVALTLSLSALSPAARTLVLSGRGVRREVRFAPGQVRTLYTRVCGRPASVPQLQMLDVQSAAAAVPQLTLQLLHVTATPL